MRKQAAVKLVLMRTQVRAYHIHACTHLQRTPFQWSFFHMNLVNQLPPYFHNALNSSASYWDRPKLSSVMLYSSRTWIHIFLT